MKRGKVKTKKTFVIQATRIHNHVFQKAFVRYINENDFQFANQFLATPFYDKEKAEAKLKELNKLKLRGISFMVVEGAEETYVS